MAGRRAPSQIKLLSKIHIRCVFDVNEQLIGFDGQKQRTPELIFSLCLYSHLGTFNDFWYPRSQAWSYYEAPGSSFTERPEPTARMISSDLDNLEDVEDDLCSCFAERIFRSSGDCTCQGVYTRHGGGGGSGLSRQRSIRLDCFHFFH